MAVWRAFSFYLAPIALVAAFVAIVAFMAGGKPKGIVTDTGQTTLPTGIMVQPGAILGGQALRIGEAITNGTSPATTPVGGLQRPVGSFVYTRDGTQSFTKTGAAATAWTAVGAAGTLASDALNTRAAALTGISSSTLTCFHDDFVYNPGGGATSIYTSLIGGGGTITPLGTTEGGQVQIASGAAASGLVILATGATMFGLPASRKFYLAIRAAITSTIDALTFAVAGGEVVGFANSISLGICGNNNTVNYILNYDASSHCVGTFLNTGVPFIQNQFRVLELWGLGDGQLHAAIDLTEVPGSPVTMASPPPAPMHMAADIRNQTTAVTRTMAIDYFHGCWSQPP